MKNLASYIDLHAEKIFIFFDQNDCGEKVKFKILSIEEYDNEIRRAKGYSDGVDVSNWHIGCFLNNEINLIAFECLKDLEKFQRTFEQYQMTALHEFVHFVNGLFNKTHECGNTEKYLSEGIACYLSGQKEGKTINFDCTIEDVLNCRANYDCYYALTKYLVENFDKKFVFELFESNREAKEFLKSELFEKVKNS